MSTRGTAKKEITHSASMKVFDANGYRVMLYDIYDELTAHRFRSRWKTVIWSMISAGSAGLVEWIINDVLIQDTLKEFQWLCPKSFIYGSVLLFGIFNLIFYYLSHKWAYTSGKKKFVDKYFNYDEQSIISHDFTISSKPARTTANTGIPLNNEKAHSS